MTTSGSEGRGEAPKFTVKRSILFATILVVGFLGLLEGGLRLAGVSRRARPRILLRKIDVDITFPFMRPDRDTMWGLKPGFQGEFQGQRVSINRLGLRGAEVPAVRDPRTPRIVCFGESVTFGYGVADTETYPERLQAALAAAGVDAQVLNAGVTGFTSHQVRALAARILPELRPDVVTLAIGWNDSSRRPVDDRQYAQRMRMSMPLDSALDHLAIYSFLKARYVRWWFKQLPSRNDVRRVPLDHYAENLAAIVATCREVGARPVFIELPRRRRAKPGAQRPPDWTYPDAFEAAAKRLGVPLLPAGPLGRRAGDAPTEALFIDSLHLSVDGNRLLGETLAREMVAGGILEK